MLIRSPWRWLGLMVAGVALGGLVVAFLVGAAWSDAIIASPSGRWLRSRTVLVIFAVFLAACVAAPAGLVMSAAIGLRARSRGNRRLAGRAGKAFLLCLGLLIGIGLCELVCARQLRDQANLVHPPAFALTAKTSQNQKQHTRSPLNFADLPKSATLLNNKIDIVIIGGSSAKGIPFAPRMSLDRVIAWQLGRAFPGRTVRADNRAESGCTLESAIERLSGLARRPDLLIIYSGHNEFQSRFGWQRKVRHYRLESKLSPPTMARKARRWSSTAELLGRGLDRFETAFAPLARLEKDAADSPCCTQAEYTAILTDYRRRLDGLLVDCDTAGILTMIVVPPSNDGGFDPNRSILPPDTSPAEQRAFIARLEEARRDEASDPARAIEGYRRLIAEQPGFAEAHFWLARLLEAAGAFDEAREKYTRARDLDGLPIRCPTPFLEVCRELGRRHRAIVVDAPRLLASASSHGIADGRMFDDAHHPGLNAVAIMARDALRQLKERAAFGWPSDVPAPAFTMLDCIARFNLDQDVWIKLCESSYNYYTITAVASRDPAWRRSVAARYERALLLLKAGKSPDETGIPALKTGEELRVESLPLVNVRSIP